MVKIARSNTMDWAVKDAPDGFRIARRHLTAATDACNLGCSRYRLDPGMKACPAHHHYGNDEAIFVLSGALTLLVDDVPHALTDGDYVTLPRGTGEAHQLENRSDTPVDYLCFSTMEPVDVVLYPKSGKVGIFGGMAPGGREGASTIREFVKNTPVDYWDGEAG